jgi:beta-1,4-N-acetylglucosaminyltransferase
MLVCSSGGHLLQLFSLEGAWRDRERLWITFDKSDARVLLAEERVIHAFGPTNRNVGNLLRNARLAWTLLRRERPAAILTTGAGVAVPFAWIGRALGVQVLYVESVTRIEEMSLSGRMIRPVAERVFVQWPELTATDPKRLHFAGNLFAD